VNKFVFLDNVQLSRQSWQTRNRILVSGHIHWVTVPIQHANVDQRIDETRISDGAHWRKKISRVLAQSYARHPYKNDLNDLIEAIENGSEETLSELNVALIVKAMDKLKIATPIQCASEMALTSEDRTDKLIEIGQKLGCYTYLSPTGSSGYLTTDRFIDRTSIKLEYANEAPPPYRQRGNDEFVSHLSVADVVANLGWDGTAAYIHREWKRPGEAK
jgi:hypothetical protein